MTPTEIAAMQADREAGTKGPWDVHPNCDGHMGRLDVVGPTLTCRGFTIATNVDARKAARINSDANRIARVPQMEDTILAQADLIAEMVEALRILVDETCDYANINRLGDPERQSSIKAARAALAKAKAATGGTDDRT